MIGKTLEGVQTNRRRNINCSDWGGENHTKGKSYYYLEDLGGGESPKVSELDLREREKKGCTV